MLKVKVNGGKAKSITFDDDSLKSGKIGNKKFNWDIQLINKEGEYYHIIKDNLSYNTSILNFDHETKSFVISVRGNEYKVNVKDEYDELLEHLGIDSFATKKVNDIKAPMPGLVKDIQVEVEDEVSEGQSLLVLEAMKMENIIKSPVNGHIKSIDVKKDTAVDKGQVLIKFK